MTPRRHWRVGVVTFVVTETKLVNNRIVRRLQAFYPGYVQYLTVLLQDGVVLRRDKQVITDAQRAQWSQEEHDSLWRQIRKHSPFATPLFPCQPLVYRP